MDGQNLLKYSEKAGCPAKEIEVARMANKAFYLGIELGSTRIKAVLIDERYEAVAIGSHGWENRLENGYWTYALEDVWRGIQDAYAEMAAKYEARYGAPLTHLDGFGVSAMMHGYLAFDSRQHLLVPFRTWRNTTTGQAADALTEEFGFNIPQRWSIAHLYQAVLNEEAHLPEISYLTTLAGYVHWQLTGEKVLGNGEASGMFPIDSTTNDFDQRMVNRFDELIAGKGYGWKLRDILPKVLNAGQAAGKLTVDGVRLLDTTGKLEAGVPCAPPEGDAGTGMVATNSVAPRTGNVSAGTSVFAMVVLDKPLSKVYPEIDMVTTPTGHPVAMVHCNTCTSDLNAWVGLLAQSVQAMTGEKPDMDKLYTTLFEQALLGEKDCGGLVEVNYYSGEPVTGFDEGRPLFVRLPDARLTLANFMRAQINGAVATLKVGMDLLLENEKVTVETLMGHGGLFKTPVVGQQLVAAALNVPVAVMATAGEGGPWGMAVLAAFAAEQDGSALEDYLSEKVFADCRMGLLKPNAEDVAGFDTFIGRFKGALKAERAAIDNVN